MAYSFRDSNFFGLFKFETLNFLAFSFRDSKDFALFF